MYRFNGFTEKANTALNLALEVAEELGNNYVGSEHILLGLIKEGTGVASVTLTKLGLTTDRLYNLVKEKVGSDYKINLTTEYFTPRTKRILQISKVIGTNLGHGYIGTEHLLLAIIEDGDSYAVKFLEILNIEPRKIVAELSKVLNSNVQENQKIKESKTPLEQFAKDLTKLAAEDKIDPVIGRKEEIERVIQILSRRTKNNPVLIGEPGVGKTAVAEGLALEIYKGEVPETLKGKKIMSLDLTAMVAGTKYRGDFEERIKSAIDEVKANENIILFIDELHTIIGTGASEGSSDAANILKPALARGDFQIIGATTNNEYRKYVEKDSALERRFQPVKVGEPSEEETTEILMGIKDKYEAHHKVQITAETVASAVKFSARYINDRFLPDKAIDLIDEAASRVRLRTFKIPDELQELENKIKDFQLEKEAAVNAQDFESAAKLRDMEQEVKDQLKKRKDQWDDENEHKNSVVTPEDIAQIVSMWTGVPVVQLKEEESERLLRLEETIHNRLIGQKEAVSAVARAIRRGRVGLKDKNRPIGSFIFLGPTGVGKTELCKALSETMFGSEKSMIRLDMSEYMEKHTVSRLIGSPPGYVGFEEGGQLTEAIRKNPYSVVLLDEIEKAHPDVFNILLQVLDDGRLTDSQGKVVDFKNTVIIMTSNVGARLITEKITMNLGFSTSSQSTDFEKTKELVMKELKQLFRPEFLNRVDDIIVFNKLKQDEIEVISGKILENLSKKLNEMDINMEFTQDVVTLISKEGFDDLYGARPLKRAIQNKIEDEISQEILENKILPNNSYVCHVMDNKIQIKTA